MVSALATCYRLPGPQIIHETIDGEVVVINLDTGAYYSLDGVGVVLWERVVAGATEAGLIEVILSRYIGDLPTVTGVVRAFLAELVEDGLVARAEVGAVGAAEDEWGAEPAVKPPFVPPILHKYTDMQELISLDPIHEVDETGWPNRRPGFDTH